MSPYTTPIAPMTSGAIRLCVPAAALIVGFGPAEEKAASDAVAAVAAVRSDDPRVFAAAREADVELLQLAVQMRAFESRLVGSAAHVALLTAEQLLEIDALERFARLAKRSLEKARR